MRTSAPQLELELPSFSVVRTEFCEVIGLCEVLYFYFSVRPADAVDYCSEGRVTYCPLIADCIDSDQSGYMDLPPS